MWRSALCGEAAQELVALLHSTPGPGAGVRLIDDDEVRACAQKLVAATLALYVVEADDGERVDIEDALARRQITLEPAGACAVTATAWISNFAASSATH